MTKRKNACIDAYSVWFNHWEELLHIFFMIFALLLQVCKLYSLFLLNKSLSYSSKLERTSFLIITLGPSSFFLADWVFLLCLRISSNFSFFCSSFMQPLGIFAFFTLEWELSRVDKFFLSDDPLLFWNLSLLV